MKTRTLLLLLIWVVVMPAYATAGEPDSCEPFFLALKAVPHDKLSHSDGEHLSLWDQKKYAGCEVQFVSHDDLLAGQQAPDFDALKGSEMYRRGWRMNNSIGADGPGSGIFGIEKEAVLCLVSHAQPSYIDDDGTFVQSETLSMTIQCRQQ